MPVEVDTCPLCESRQKSLFDRRSITSSLVVTKDNPPLLVENYICMECGFVYKSPRMTDEETSVFYDHEYRLFYQGSQGPTKKDITVQKLRAEHLRQFVENQLASLNHQPIKNHLDIGCSAGLLLKKFKETFQCSAAGVEPGQEYRDYASDSGLKIYPSLEQLMQSTDIAKNRMPPFDLISMIHVLEHIPHPIEYLDNLRRKILTDDGWLLLEVPNLYAHDCFEIAHLVSFSKHTLEQTLQKAGFTLNKIKAHGEPRSSNIQLYLTVLARPAPSKLPWVCTPERGVRQKRDFGMMRRRILSRLTPGKAWKPLPLENE